MAASTLAVRPALWSFLGRVPYPEGEALQRAAREAIRRGEGPDRFFLLEHPNVYTLGRNATPADVLASPAWLSARGFEVVECDRGGQVTYHGPGQLVGYPVINLSPDRRDIRRYVHDLQEVLLRTLADYGVTGERREGQEYIGIWVEGAKIASIGVHLSRWITTHGFALNVTTDLGLFAGIIPCGLSQVRMTSLAALTGRTPPLAEVAARAAAHFGAVFEREMVASGVAETLVPAGRLG
ncbi:MAG TPA: lipoyl(octanoyl) transferase LipB [Thermoanaerobaculia bacterium]|nr:lipoyl(octanoyl) transferase LipB [Thermoanaerobaculia bacterium]